MNKDQIKGAAKEAAGETQEQFGKVIGSANQEAKGRAKAFEGKAQKKLGDLKEDAADAVEEVKDAVEDAKDELRKP